MESEILLAIGPWQIVLIVALVLLLFGGKKIPELMRGLGKGLGEFKKGKEEIKKDLEEGKEEIKKDLED
jgi:sec-independent protein translocase protein TatA